LTGVENDDTFIITGDVKGGTSAAGNSDGGTALSVAMKTNSGSDVLNLEFKAGAATAVAGGAAKSVGAATDGGDGLDAATIENINITTDSADDDVTFTGGAAGGAGASGSSFAVGANATVTIEGAGDVDLGTVVAPSVDTDDLTIDGSEMTGKLTVVTGAGNDVIKGGSKGDDITAGAGTNTLTGNGGSDTFKVLATADNAAIASMSEITDFSAGTGGDVLDETGGVRDYDALTATQRTNVAGEDTLALAVDLALSYTTNNDWTAFSYGDETYALYRNDDATYNANEEFIIKLSGVTVTDLVAANFA
jgi:hypothetical protein